MPRPRLEIGTYGKIRFCRSATGWRAMTFFRDFDGRTRPVERSGKTKGAAERNLKRALQERTGVAGGEIKPDTKLRDLSAAWLLMIEGEAAQGKLSPSTLTTYRSILDRYVIKGVGEWSVREASVARIDRFLSTLSLNVGAPTAKTARTVLSGMLVYAARHGAIGFNPTRDTRPLSTVKASGPRALTPAERSKWLEQLEADEKAARWGLPDISRFMIATGVRIGEALALYWEDVDLDAGVVHILYTVVRVQGVGLVRKSTKTAAGERVLPLPSWAVQMLKRRQKDAEDDDRPEASPVFPNVDGGLRDPSNVLRVLRESRGSEGFEWVTSHVFRKTAATVLDERGLTARQIADHLGHSRPSMTQDVYMARKVASTAAAEALEDVLGNQSAAFPTDNLRSGS